MLVARIVALGVISIAAVAMARAQAPQPRAGMSHGHPSGRTAAANHPLPIPPIPPAPPVEKPAAAAPSKPAFDPNKGAVTGLPIPRYVSLRADVVNLRSGPGERYPIEWVYKHVGMPVEILREFDVWRLVETPDGDKGWMHEATLIGRRDFIIAEHAETLRSAANDTAKPVATLEPGVIGRIRSCDTGATWCQVDVNGYTGWLQRTAMWGLLPNEVVKP